MNEPVIITGFMGAGKTTVARALAQVLRCGAIDLDQFITEEERRTPKEIIEQDGEAAFREVETRRLQQALSLDSDRVIALGGGAWTLQRNRDLIARHQGITVWIDAPFELCWQRITQAGMDRPLAPNKQQAQKLYEERRPAYALASFHLIADGNTDMDGLAVIIADSLY